MKLHFLVELPLMIISGTCLSFFKNNTLLRTRWSEFRATFYFFESLCSPCLA
jgi:hypothetical protein